MSDDIRAWDRGFVWHPYTPASSVAAGEMPVIVRGKGFIYSMTGVSGS
ncbi:MAG: hypothetical protein M5U15_04120 [Kiritimatiellae bacterium]|nr:hypothetical protein [Kiritimatiellia bacterium]